MPMLISHQEIMQRFAIDCIQSKQMFLLMKIKLKRNKGTRTCLIPTGVVRFKGICDKHFIAGNGIVILSYGTNTFAFEQTVNLQYISMKMLRSWWSGSHVIPVRKVFETIYFVLLLSD
ncbi:hypothetical protein SDC9_207488 [bioreactor metagenome]|uniref:Uncharacterized protein n=1 Tax=bioreactor metagenome TaxID=1076179 RepID=A0A645J8L9_9ZZZZ